MKIEEVVLRRVDLPLIAPYSVSYRSYTSFDPYIIEVVGADGKLGWGEGLISPGSSAETRDGGWRFLCHHAHRIVGQETAIAKSMVDDDSLASPIAASAVVTAIEMLEGSDVLDVHEEHRVPLLAMVVAHEHERIPEEIERHIAQGFRALKVKVGFDLDEDLRRVAAIQQAAAGRARLTLDANRAFDRETACRFAASLNPEGIDQLEQPCAAEDWDANAAVAAVSTVPLMLDESIMRLPDIERAARIPGIGFLKLKLRKAGSLARLLEEINAIHAAGLSCVLGDGTSTEIHCWMEACVARRHIRTPGQMNGFLKTRARLLREPLVFDAGDIHLKPGFKPEIDREALNSHTVEVVRIRQSLTRSRKQPLREADA